MNRGGHVSLVGLSGTGKSTVAPLLAKESGVAESVDLDRLIEARFGLSVAAIFTERGETAFRRAEAEVLKSALDGPPAVIATGGGVVLNPANREQLSTRSTVVWLRARPAALAARLSGTSETRPLLAADHEATLERLLTERRALYTEVADHVVDVDELDPLAVVDHIARLLR